MFWKAPFVERLPEFPARGFGREVDAASAGSAMLAPKCALLDVETAAERLRGSAACVG